MVGKIILAVILLIILYLAYRAYTVCKHPSKASGLIDGTLGSICHLVTMV